MRRRTSASLITVVLLMQAACSDPDAVGEPPPQDGISGEEEVADDDAPDTEATPDDTVADASDTGGAEVDAADEIDAEAIRAFDFANALWQDERNVSEVPLVDGTFTGEYGQVWTYTDEPVYADVDGDGYEDALAPLTQEDGQGLVTQWFLWRWDADAAAGDTRGQAVQLLEPVAVMARCGSEVHEVAAGNGAFSVTESIRMADAPISCADSPTRERTRSVALEDGLLVQVDPVRGYGGVCGTNVHDHVAGVPSSWQVRIAPQEDAPLVVEIEEVHDAVLYLSGDTPMRPDGWVMVGLDTGAGVEAAHWPCGFIIGEHSG